MTARFLYSISLATFAVIALLPREGFARDPKKPALILSTDLSGGDLQFFTSATEEGLYQAMLGVLAADHAKSAEVKELGQNIARRHATQNEQIKLLAIKKGVSIPSSPTAKQNATAEKLGKLQGLKFDKAYLEAMVEDQQAYASAFEQAVQSRDPDIKSFASTALPEIKKNLALVRQMTGLAAPASTAAPHSRANTPGTNKN